MSAEVIVTLKAGRHKSALKRHPWMFSGAVATVQGEPASGDTVLVRTSDGQPLGRAAWSPESQIRLRMWSFDPAERIEREFFSRRIHNAIALRERLFPGDDTNAWRVISSEADGIPGLIVDRYADTLVCQFLSAGAEAWKDVIVAELESIFAGLRIYERSEGDSRSKEGLPERQGLLSGDELPERIEVLEDGLRFNVDCAGGHKTGFYLDQRDNRIMLGTACEGADVLNCFSYTGGFAMQALAGGASQVTDVDVSADALRIAVENVSLNGFDDGRYEQVEADVFHFLRSCRDSRKEFDVIVLDPPKFAASASQVDRASRGYKDINLLAMKLLRPGGLLFTFSCSGHITEPLFRKIVAGAALDAGREAHVLASLSQAPDHPVALHIPESWYLKGLLCRIS